MGGADEKLLEKGRTQTSKAIEVMQSAQSINVFINWLRYQAARASSEQFWNHKTANNDSLVLGLTKSLGELRQLVTAAMPHAEPTLQNQVVMQAATRFLGYFRRSLIGAKFLKEIRLVEPGSAKTQKEAARG